MNSALLACFYCGIDSTPLLVFLIALIGSLVLATVFIGVGLSLRGNFRESEDIKYDVFEADSRGGL